MSWWNAKYTNNDGEYEITFASKDYEKAKAVEKVCCAVMDKAVKSPLDVAVVVRCKDCKNRFEDSWCEYVMMMITFIVPEENGKKVLTDDVR